MPSNVKTKGEGIYKKNAFFWTGTHEVPAFKTASSCQESAWKEENRQWEVLEGTRQCRAEERNILRNKEVRRGVFNTHVSGQTCTRWKGFPPACHAILREAMRTTKALNSLVAQAHTLFHQPNGGECTFELLQVKQGQITSFHFE